MPNKHHQIPNDKFTFVHDMAEAALASPSFPLTRNPCFGVGLRVAGSTCNVNIPIQNF